MGEQKQSIVELVAAQRTEGRRMVEVLGSVGVACSSYYRWRKSEQKQSRFRQSSYEITVEEQGLIDEIKEQHPVYRHRRIEGVSQQRGVYLSASAIYGYLKSRGRVERYERRPAPWKSPRYEIWQRNLIGGATGASCG